MITQLPPEIPPHIIKRYLSDWPFATTGHQLQGLGKGAGPEHYTDTLKKLGEERAGKLSIYIHVPFCAVRCHFCACNTNITHDSRKIEGYLDTLEKEMDLVVEYLGRGWEVSELHVGGGSPNYLTESQLARLMEIVDDHFRLADDICACIECNPRWASVPQLELLRNIGFERVSLGVQDLSPQVQRIIGRMQSAAVIRDVCRMARDTNFRNIKVDLIYGLPDQTEDALAMTLEHIIRMQPDRISCLSYEHTPSLRPHQAAIPAQSLPGTNEKFSLFLRIVKDLTQAGYQWIGADCFALPQDDWSQAQAEERLGHNSIGYTAQATDYQLAFGTHGLGELGPLFVQNEPQLGSWTQAIKAGRLPIAWGHRFSDEEYRRHRAYNHLLCNLRLTDHLELEGLAMETFITDGLFEREAAGLRVTPLGRLFLRSLCVQRAASLDWASAQWRFPRNS